MVLRLGNWSKVNLELTLSLLGCRILSPLKYVAGISLIVSSNPSALETKVLDTRHASLVLDSTFIFGSAIQTILVVALQEMAGIPR